MASTGSALVSPAWSTRLRTGPCRVRRTLRNWSTSWEQQPDGAGAECHVCKEGLRELENFGPREEANPRARECCFRHVTSHRVEAGADVLTGYLQTSHSQCWSARIHGTNPTPYPTHSCGRPSFLDIPLPPPHLQESKELVIICHCSHSQSHISCGDSLASSRNLVVKKPSQLLFLFPHLPGGNFYSPSGLNVLTGARL